MPFISFREAVIKWDNLPLFCPEPIEYSLDNSGFAALSSRKYNPGFSQSLGYPG